MERVALVAVGPAPGELLEEIAAGVSRILGVQVVVEKGRLPLPRDAPRRGEQILARAILTRLRGLRADASRVLGVTEADLYAPGLNFVFGEADVGGRAGVISLARLRPEWYGMAPDEGLVLQRALKEAVHELGHTFGLAHCARPRCVMRFSDTLEDADRKSERPCAECAAQLAAQQAGDAP